MQVKIYTDGAARGNPDGPGGYGAVLQYIDTKGQLHERELSRGYKKTTNNRMELMAAIMGLRTLNEPCQVRLTTDSQYVRQGITQWIIGWKKKGWMTANRQPVKNVDLWQALDAEVARHQIEWLWVKGHSGHPENERCDELAREAASGKQLAEDSGYQP